MRHRITELLAWSKTHDGKKVLRFTAVSGVSTLVSFSFIFLAYSTRMIKGEVAATVFGNLVATLPSYYLNRRWTWGKQGKSHLRKEIVPFWSMSLLGITFSILLAYVAKGVVHHHHWHILINTVIVVGANLLSFGIFWLLKLKVFNRIFHVNELAEMDEHLTHEESSHLAT
ncbi:MAG: GtrA family protein [Actinomycetota bacterium]|jgi:hypothetical protein